MGIVPVYVGLDYHSETIRVCVMDEAGEVLVNRNVANDPAAVVDLVRVNCGLVQAVSIEACRGGGLCDGAGGDDRVDRADGSSEWRESNEARSRQDGSHGRLALGEPVARGLSASRVAGG